MRRSYIAAVSLLSLSALAVPMLWQGLKTVKYTVRNEKMNGKIRIAAVSDLHSCRYGKNNSHLIRTIANNDPDIVIFTGDTVDDRVDPSDAFDLIRTLSQAYPCYYVSGNHEFYRGRCDDIKRIVSSCGATVLCGDCVRYEKNGAEVDIFGLDDRHVGLEWGDQMSRITPVPSVFSLLLSHRPDLFDDYASLGVDLTVCGHAHGGQVIVPGVINGLYAPHQGFFPKYAGGRYKKMNTEMIVSRGLMKNMFPRVMNPPELVIIDVVGE